MSCKEFVPYLEAYVDDELSPERMLEVGEHLKSCSSCRTEVELSRELARTTRASCIDVELQPDFAARLQLALHTECRRQEARSLSASFGRKTLLPLSAAAVAALTFGVLVSQKSALFSPERLVADAGSPNALQAGNSPGFGQSTDHLVDLLLQYHTRAPAPDVTDSGSVMHLEPQLGFPVRTPNFDRYGARFLGANLIHFNRSHAASLHYSLNGRRVTLYMYNPEELPLRAIRALHPTVVGDRAVFVGQRNGYSIATCEREGVGYAVAADLSDRESAELVAAVDRW